MPPNGLPNSSVWVQGQSEPTEHAQHIVQHFRVLWGFQCLQRCRVAHATAFDGPGCTCRRAFGKAARIFKRKHLGHPHDFVGLASAGLPLGFFHGNQSASVWARCVICGRRSGFLLARGSSPQIDFQTIVGLAHAGWGLLIFAWFICPAWTYLAGHRYPAVPTSGLPCPTTIFTIGLLAFLVAPYPRSPLFVPVLWCFVGSQAAFLFNVPPDPRLVVAGGVGIVLLVRSKATGARSNGIA